MKHPDSNEIKQLTQKLKDQGDISLKEANMIYSLFSENSMKTKLNCYSRKYDRELLLSLKEWYDAVAEEIKKDRRGNFIFTITFKIQTFSINLINIFHPVREVLKEQGRLEDLCGTIIMDKKTYSVFPLKFLFDTTDLGNYYEMRNHRAGIYYYPVKTKTETYTLAQFMENFFPVEKDKLGGLTSILLKVFKIAAGAEEVPQEKFFLARFTIRPYTLAAFMRNENISCMVAVDTHDDKSAFLVERNKMSMVKEVLEFPFEMLVENALNHGIINKEVAKNLLDENYFMHTNFPVKEFVEASAEYVGHIIRRKKEWKRTKKEIEDEDEWLVEIR